MDFFCFELSARVLIYSSSSRRPVLCCQLVFVLVYWCIYFLGSFYLVANSLVCCVFLNTLTLKMEPRSRRWGTAGAEIEVSAAEGSELLKVLSFQPGLGRNIVLHASHTARNSELLTGSFTHIPPPPPPPRSSCSLRKRVT